MSVSLAHGLPLLRKELVEQAARRRTYLVRTLYALVLGIVFAAVLAPVLQSSHSIGRILGTGREAFEVVGGVLLVSVLVLLPAMMGGVFPVERERGSLALLHITLLRSWEILFEKFLGRLVPMVTLFLVALPLFAVSYSFGGLSLTRLWVAFFLLVLTCVQVGAIAIFLSVVCRTVVQAILLAYVVELMLYLVLPGIAAGIVNSVTGRFWADLWVIFPPFLYFEDLLRGSTFVDIVVRSLPAAGIAALFLGGAWLVLRRGPLPAPKRVKRARKPRSWQRGRYGRSRVISGLPSTRPVAWREAGGNILGQTRTILLSVILVGGPLLALSALGAPQAAVSILWLLALVRVTLVGANALVSERVNQTLDVLLTTPITGREIVRQKTRALNRVFLVITLFLLPFFLIETSTKNASGWIFNLGPWEYLCISGLSLSIFVPMFFHFAFWIGLRMKTKGRAVLTALFGMLAWNALPLAVGGLLASLDLVDDDSLPYVLIASPATAIFFAESSLRPEPLWVLVTMSCVWHVHVLIFLRILCLRRADRYLQRLEAPEPAREAWGWAQDTA